MRLTAQTEIDTPVVACSLGDRHQFVYRHTTYEDFIHEVQKSYGLSQPPKLLVSTFEVCDGKDYEIGKNVYKVMAPYLDKVKILPRNVSQQGEASERTVKKSVTPPVAPKAVVPEDDDELAVIGKPISKKFRADEHISADTPVSSETEGELWQHIAPQPTPAEEPKESKPVSKRAPAPSKEQEEPSAHRTTDRAPSASVSKPTPPPPCVPAEEVDDRFKMHITGPEKGQRAEFMTRRRHPVRKVLLGACKTFDVDYHSARLMLVTANGTRIACTKTSTLEDCGIDTDSKLVLELVEEDEEEDDEEED